MGVTAGVILLQHGHGFYRLLLIVCLFVISFSFTYGWPNPFLNFQTKHSYLSMKSSPFIIFTASALLWFQFQKVLETVTFAPAFVRQFSPALSASVTFMLQKLSSKMTVDLLLSASVESEGQSLIKVPLISNSSS